MGLLKLILNFFLLWTVPLPCPGGLSIEKEILRADEKEQSREIQDHYFIVNPAELIISTEDLPVFRYSPASGFLNPVPEGQVSGILTAIGASSSPYQHLHYERRLIFPFHSFL